jgi:cell division protein FtsW (lipid II flippase)
MKTVDWIRRFPWLVAGASLALVVIGWVAIGRCEEFTGTGSRYQRQQVIWSVTGLGVMLGMTIPSYRAICRWSYGLYGGVMALLVAVYLCPAVNGAHRWIRLGPVGVQPSELAKVVFVLALARYLMYRENYRHLWGFGVPLVLTLAPMLLILKEPDLGTSLLFAPVFVVMLFVAGARRGDLLRLAVIGVLLAPVLWTQMSREQRSRVVGLFQQTAPGQRPSDDAYQLHQGKQMLALGGVWGSGLTGPSSEDPAAYFLPEARSDFVFCVLGERFGLCGLAVVLGLYGVMAGRGFSIAATTREPYGRLVAAGMAAMLGTQVLVNTGMNVGLLPVTGVSLPLISYGGSGLLAYGLAVGLILNVGLRPGYEVTTEPFRWNEGGGTGGRR